MRAATRDFKSTRQKVVCHAIVLLLPLPIAAAESDLFKVPRVLTATNNDDHYFDTLILRENDTSEMYGTGLLPQQTLVTVIIR